MQQDRPFRYRDRNRVPSSVDQRARGFQRGVPDLAQLHPRTIELELSACDARHIQQIIEQKRHLLYLSLDHLATPANLLLARARLIDDRGGLPDGRERVAQLMCERGKELVLTLVGFLQ